MNEKFYVPFETAKLLKEKGYPQSDSDMYYTHNGELKSQADIYADLTDNDPMMYSYFLTTYHIAAPAYHEVVDWLEGKGVRIYAEYNENWIGFIDYGDTEGAEEATICQTREEVLNAAIIEALETITNANTHIDTQEAFDTLSSYDKEGFILNNMKYCSIGNAMDCFSDKTIESWLKMYAGDYGYVKQS